VIERAGLLRLAVYPDGESAVLPADVDAAVVVDLDDVGGPFGCATFTGPDRVELAARNVTRLRLLPVTVLHQLARSAAVPAQRRAGLNALRQVYSAADGVLRWDPRVARTHRDAWRDEDAAVRVDAAALEVEAFPARARHTLAAALVTATGPYREALEVLYRVVAGEPEPTSDVEDGGQVPDPDDADPLVLAVVWDGNAAAAAELFAGQADLVEHRRASIEVAPYADLVVLRPHGFDASITIAAAGGGVVAAAFGGPDRAAVAAGATTFVSYLPTELAVQAAVVCRDPALRVQALRALVLVSSRRLFPGAPPVPGLAAVLSTADADPAPQVRAAARTARALLRDELAPKPGSLGPQDGDD